MNKYPTILNTLKERLDGKRLSHTLAVADTAYTLGKRYGCSDTDCERLYVAGLLHDVTKRLSTAEHIEICRRASYPLTEDDLASPPILHAISGAIVAKRDFSELVDEGICRAIALHTTGAADMSLLDKLLYLSDYIEPTRKHTACLEARRAFLEELDHSDDPVTVLNHHLLAITEATAAHLIEENRPVHPQNDEMIRFLKNELKQ